MNNMFSQDPFDFFGTMPRGGQRYCRDAYRQPPRQRRAQTNPFFYHPYEEEEEEIDDYYNSHVAQQPKRQVPNQKQQRNANKSRKTSRKLPPTPIKNTKVNNPPSPKMDENLMNESAIVIQKAFRAYSIQKVNILSNLRLLKEVSDKVNRAEEKFNNLLSMNPDLSGEKLRYTYAEFEENLTKSLLKLDTIVTHGVDIVRQKRKDIVKRVNTCLSKVDSMKDIIAESVRLEKEQERKAQEEKSQMEIDNESESEQDFEDYNTYDEMVSWKNQIEQEEIELEEDRLEIERLLEQYNQRKKRVEEERQTIDEYFSNYNQMEM